MSTIAYLVSGRLNKVAVPITL